MSEVSDYKYFKRKFAARADRIDRIENSVVVGMPDVNMCVEGVEIWMEIKSPTLPKKESTPVFGSNHKVSQDQKNWFLRQKIAEGRGVLMIFTQQHLIAIEGCNVDPVNELTLKELIDLSFWTTRKPTVEEAWKRLRNSKQFR